MPTKRPLGTRSGAGLCAPSRITTTGSNGDEDRYRGSNGRPNRIGNFHKGLPHNEFGEVRPAAYDSNACLVLLGTGAPFDEGNPYNPPNPHSRTQAGFGTFGGPHVLSLVTEVATRALKAVWHQKWFVHRRLRPEAFGGLVHLKLQGRRGTKRDYPIHDQVLGSVALRETFSTHGSYLLPMAFPEGSPTHPAYGAGHATVAGACVTILKAWFDERHPIASPVVPTNDGLELVPYTGPGAQELTVGGELNKLAANIAIGRNMAGVHWRSDYLESVRLGERVALCVLFNQRKDYHEDYSLTLIGFDGDLFKITPDKITKNGKDFTAVCRDT